MMPTPNLADVLQLRACLGIVHHVPGRLRLRVRPDPQSPAPHPQAATAALGWLRQAPGVTGVRVNAAAASVVVDYQPDRLPPPWWETLVLGDDAEALGAVLDLLGTA